MGSAGITGTSLTINNSGSIGMGAFCRRSRVLVGYSRPAQIGKAPLRAGAHRSNPWGNAGGNFVAI
jgi:hypothetical protein